MKIQDKLKVLEPKVKISISNLIKELEKNIDLLYEIATIDEKTGVYNHKFFDTISRIEFEKAKRGKDLSILIVDIDNFKKLNDTYGHFFGDKVLKKLADVLKENVRKYDIVARFGGEEFFVLFPETNLKKSKIVARRIMNSIRNENLLKKYNVTVSGGIVDYKDKDTFAKMKLRADKALYKAKKEGKDRIIEG